MSKKVRISHEKLKNLDASLISGYNDVKGRVTGMLTPMILDCLALPALAILKKIDEIQERRQVCVYEMSILQCRVKPSH